MALRNKLCRNVDLMGYSSISWLRSYSSKRINFKKLRPMILERIESRAKDYPVAAMVDVAEEVLRARAFLYHGVSMLLKYVPVVSCKFCSEVYIGERGHLIRTCSGYRRIAKNRVHEWVRGGLNDILVPVETFHLDKMFQGVIKHNQRFDFDRIPAVVELCLQAGADPKYSNLEIAAPSSDNLDPLTIGHHTLKAWEYFRSGVQKLLFVYPAKVCEYCSEVHVGPSGHKARLCGIFKYESWRGAHHWKNAKVDDLVPPKIVWSRRSQDPPVLLDEGRSFYGHAPAVVDLCSKAGVAVPVKYNCLMKVQGLSKPTEVKLDVPQFVS